MSLRRWFTPLVLFVLAGCSTLPPGADVPKHESRAYAQPEQTRYGRQFADAGRAHAGESAFRMLSLGAEGFATRRQIIGKAERSLDLQYFIYRGDTTGSLLTLALLQAADRGVHVRLLLDDGDIRVGDDQVTALSAHENIELRYFNPLSYRGTNAQRRGSEILLGLHRLDYRMHNKLLVADNSVALVGGRNIGDEYFQVDPEAQLADDDLFVAGPAVPQLSRSFDEFWNSALAIPNETLLHGRPAPAALDALRLRLQQQQDAATAAAAPFLKLADSGQPLDGLLDGSRPLRWARWKLFYDTPYKQQIDRGERSGRLMVEPITDVAASVRQELLIVTPYFVPTNEELALLKDLARRQVRVRVLTNSLASTDEIAAQAGYARHRVELLKAGVELNELRARPGSARGTGQSASMSAWGNLGLHAKLLVFDRRRAFIGSMNVDHRSAQLNTEIGLVIDSPELAAQAAARFEALTQPSTAWRVELAGPADELRWRTELDGRAVETAREPARSPWQRTKLALWMLLPIDGEL